MTTPDQLRWRTSTYTGEGENCVEVAPTGDGMLMRDTKDHGTGPVIYFGLDQWPAFLGNALGDCADTDANVVSITEAVTPLSYGGITATTNWHVHCRDTGVTLHFTAGEWAAFLAGVRSAQFDFKACELLRPAAAAK
ncbi:MAG: DUF397 domain-containing protein [Actinomycetota bacterium]|nr:DUF397 domain-containing protein [Actinomycetota bacterium]